MRKLSAANAMSENSRHLHSQLLKAISCQACIPLFYLAAAVTYGLGQLDVIHHPILEYSSLIYAGFMPMLAPLASLYFIQPYRGRIYKNLLRKRISVLKTSRGTFSEPEKNTVR
ncbi:hypothetical protein OESDEN_07002 [Oesophagostomum dentatum]|uniref:Uncharacterized protein n=1 Tax=Oesophagostomum dentatum TaxID=61180 RepID=A0A0B1TCN9_OESDE|nr:hypothetical protein OESDEN_07002 [Oesophagostomum dentatum]